MISPTAERAVSPLPDRQAIAVDMSFPGKVRINMVDLAGMTRPDLCRTYETAGFQTFTDVLRAFERDQGLRLRGCDCVVAVPGACSSGTIAVANSSWIITRSGLTALFGRPVQVINEAAAAALASRRPRALTATPVGIGPSLDFSSPGRRGLICTDIGLGLGVLEVGLDGTARASEAEPGHLAFAPENEMEDRLMLALRRTGQVTWERVLLLPFSDPTWEVVAPGATAPQINQIRAALFGSFAANVATAYVLWQGLLLMGPVATILQDRCCEAEFVRRMKGGDRHFRALLSGTPCWISDARRDLVMVGAASLLATH
jgi:glucokinase